MTGEREVKPQAAMQPSGHEQCELTAFTVGGPQRPHHSMIFGRVAIELMGEASCNGVADEQQWNAETQQDAKKIGRRHAQCLWQKQEPSPWLAASYSLARALVFRPMLMKVGMHKVSAALTAGAPIPQAIQALWQVWGVNLRNLYGITEHTLVLCQSEPFQEPT